MTTKNNLLIIILILLLLGKTSYCQVFSGYGFKGGLVSAFNSETPANDFARPKLGINAGIFGEFFKYKKISTNFETNFIEKGINDRLSYPTVIDQYSTLNILSLSLLEKLNYFSYRKFSLYYGLGPRADILLSKKDGSYEQKLYKNINPINFGISLLVGSEIDLSKKTTLLVECVYSPDTTAYSSDLYVGQSLTIRNISFEFNLGLKFR